MTEKDPTDYLDGASIYTAPYPVCE